VSRGLEHDAALAAPGGPGLDRDLRRRARPQGGAARGRGEREALTEGPREEIDQHVAALQVRTPGAAHVALQLAVLEQLGDGALEDVIALAIDVPTPRDDTLDDRAGCDDVSEAQARREHLGERSDVDDDARVVRARQGEDGTAVVVELVIVVVLDDGDRT